MLECVAASAKGRVAGFAPHVLRNDRVDRRNIYHVIGELELIKVKNFTMGF